MGDKTSSAERGQEGALPLSLQGDNRRSCKPVEKQLLKSGWKCKNIK